MTLIMTEFFYISMPILFGDIFLNLNSVGHSAAVYTDYLMGVSQ